MSPVPPVPPPARAARTGRLTVRRARAADLTGVVRLWAELADHHHRLDRRFRPRAPDGCRTFRKWVREALTAKDSVLLLASVAGRPVGFAHGGLKPGPPPLKPRLGGFVSHLVVTQYARRRGVGRRLLRAVEAWCRRRGAKAVTLTAAVRNAEGQAFYAAMGFTPWTATLWKSLKH